MNLLTPKDRDALYVCGVGEQINARQLGELVSGIDEASGKAIVHVDPNYFRPTEVEMLLGDPSKAKAKLGWEAKTTFDELVIEMVDSDLTIEREAWRTDRTSR